MIDIDDITNEMVIKLQKFFEFCKENDDFHEFITSKRIDNFSSQYSSKRVFNQHKNKIGISYNFFYNSLFGTSDFYYTCMICVCKMKSSMHRVIDLFDNGRVHCNRFFCVGDKERIKNTPYYNEISNNLCQVLEKSEIVGMKLHIRNIVPQSFIAEKYNYFMDIHLYNFIQSYLKYRTQIIDFFHLRDKDNKEILCCENIDFDSNLLLKCTNKYNSIYYGNSNIKYDYMNPKKMYSVEHSDVYIDTQLFKEIIEFMLIIYSDTNTQNIYTDYISLCEPNCALSYYHTATFVNLQRIHKKIADVKRVETTQETQRLVKQIDFKCSDINYVVYGYLYDMSSFNG